MPRCKNCKKKFEPKTFLQKYCLELECIAVMREDLKRLEQRKWNKEKKVRKEKLKTRPEHLNDLQIIFNTFIRLRDKDLPCVSCGTFNGKMNAGHYRSVGSCPELRFNELNVWKQCEYCNTYLSANLINYRIELVKRIGLENVEFLERKDHKELKLTVDEIKEMQQHYKNKIKNLSK